MNRPQLGLKVSEWESLRCPAEQREGRPCDAKGLPVQGWSGMYRDLAGSVFLRGWGLCCVEGHEESGGVYHVGVA